METGTTISMTLMILHLRLAGAALLLLCLLHVFFPRRFRWKEELQALSLLNRQIFYVHTFFVGLILVMMGVPLVFEPRILLERTRLGAWVAAGFTVFWGLRLLIQWFGYSAALWRGKGFETMVHFAFTAFWAYLTGLGVLLWRHQLQ
jgi:hypothetical protein